MRFCEAPSSLRLPELKRVSELEGETELAAPQWELMGKAELPEVPGLELQAQLLTIIWEEGWGEDELTGSCPELRGTVELEGEKELEALAEKKEPPYTELLESMPLELEGVEELEGLKELERGASTLEVPRSLEVPTSPKLEELAGLERLTSLEPENPLEPPSLLVPGSVADRVQPCRSRATVASVRVWFFMVCSPKSLGL